MSSLTGTFIGTLVHTFIYFGNATLWLIGSPESLKVTSILPTTTLSSSIRETSPLELDLLILKQHPFEKTTFFGEESIPPRMRGRVRVTRFRNVWSLGGQRPTCGSTRAAAGLRIEVSPNRSPNFWATPRQRGSVDVQVAPRINPARTARERACAHIQLQVNCGSPQLLCRIHAVK